MVPLVLPTLRQGAAPCALCRDATWEGGSTSAADSAPSPPGTGRGPFPRPRSGPRGSPESDPPLSGPPRGPGHVKLLSTGTFTSLGQRYCTLRLFFFFFLFYSMTYPSVPVSRARPCRSFSIFSFLRFVPSFGAKQRGKEHVGWGERQRQRRRKWPSPEPARGSIAPPEITPWAETGAPGAPASPTLRLRDSAWQGDPVIQSNAPFWGFSSV